MKKVMIHSQGFGDDTVVIDEDGNRIENVTEVTLYMRAREINTATVEIMMVQANAEARVEDWQFTCPNCSDTELHTCTTGGLMLPRVDNEYKPYQVCGRTADIYTCYMSQEINHTIHVDTLKGACWTVNPETKINEITNLDV